jgi:preprotein translocase subunit SecA
VESFYTAGNMEWPHLIDNALKAHHLYRRDVNYVVQGPEVVIVDEFTGRLMPGRNWSDGLHQAVEAKEGVRIKEENQTLATITLQNFFKLYNKLGGMTGTAMTEAGEFWKIYKLDVVAVPPNKPLVRVNHPDVIYRTEEGKFRAIADEIERMHKWDVVALKDGEQVAGTIKEESDAEIVVVPTEAAKRDGPRRLPRDKVVDVQRRGRPILVGTVSIEKSERLSGMLQRRGIEHQVLNAKYHQREAEIVAQAGRLAAVTIATNMAGRGTDIILGGNPETMAWAQLQDKYKTRLDVPREEWDGLVHEIEQREQMKAQGRQVAALGGLHVLGTERHEARRIDLQLRGRCGRQGDPGSSRFYLSLEDDLMRIFAGDWVKNVLTRLGMTDDEAIESRMVSRRIEAAQKKVEERHFDTRKNLLEYDEVMDEQRKRVYGYRQRILNGENCKRLIQEMLDKQIDHHLGQFLGKDYAAQCFAAWAGKQFGVELRPRDFQGVDFEAAERIARDEAQRMAELQIFEAIEENLPETSSGGDEEDDAPAAAPGADWNWEALAKLVNTRWRLNVRDRDLKKIGKEGLAEHLIQQVNEAIEQIDCREGAVFLEPDFALRQVVGWARDRFRIALDVESLRGQEPPQIVAQIRELAHAAYDEREVEYPVMAGLYVAAQKRYDRDQLVAWARQRFDAELDREDVSNKQREEVQKLLVDHSRRQREQAEKALVEAHDQVQKVFGSGDGAATARAASGGNGALDSVADWLRRELHAEVPAEKLGELDRAAFERRLETAVEDRYRPEIRRMERALLLQILDAAWKDHLLAMDHLKSSVGLRGYAQVDPKVEYKREGMRTFELMWTNVGESVTRLVFRMENLSDEFVGSTFVERAAIKQEAAGMSEIEAQQQAAIAGTQTAAKQEPIRNRGQRVGRNDPCPCGSGKKFKQCCMRSGGAGNVAAL